MALNNPLANIMSKIYNADKVGKTNVVVSPASKLSAKVLEILKAKGYLGAIKQIDTVQGGNFEIELVGKINKCGVISPNFNVKKEDFEGYEKRFLPAKGFGILLVTTTKGIMTHNEAKMQNLGGRLIGYCY